MSSHPSGPEGGIADAPTLFFCCTQLVSFVGLVLGGAIWIIAECRTTTAECRATTAKCDVTTAKCNASAEKRNATAAGL